MTSKRKSAGPRAHSTRAGVLLFAALLVACPPRKDEDRAVRVEPDVPAPVEPRDPSGQAIEHTVRFPEPHTHYVEVQSVFPTGGADPLVLAMAVWTPGSYLVREYSRHLEGFSAATTDGKPLPAVKVRKNRWSIATGGADRVVVRYRLYAFEMSVRANFVDSELAVLNGAATFLVPPNHRSRAHDVRLELAPGWKQVATALDPHPRKGAHRYLAADFDTLVDSPIVAGSGNISRFEVEGVPHYLASFGEGGVWNGARASADLEKLAGVQTRFWGVIPYRSYWFLNVLYGGGGGLEHKSSTLLMSSPWRTRKRADYLGWLGLACHEMFHTWNVKRLRPAELGPFDYENEVHTKALWIAEGITSYYGDLLLVRAGLMTRKEYLATLSQSIAALQRTPGRKVLSLAMASYDAWIKHYRRNENSRNSQVSYYTKGAVVAFLLDAAIREATGGRRSLDDVMRLAYQRHGGERGYTIEQWRALVSEVSGKQMDGFLARYVDGTAELDYQPALDHYGLEFAKPVKKPSEPGIPDEPAGWLGVDAYTESGRLVISSVRRGTPAYRAGISAGDELIAIDRFRLRDNLAGRLERYRPGDKVEVMVSRRGRLRSIQVELGKQPDLSYRLQPVKTPTAAQKRRLQSWLGDRSGR